MAIKKTIKDGIVHTYSDAGLKIQRKDSKFPVNNAFEEVGKEHEWEEVEPEPTGEEAL